MWSAWPIWVSCHTCSCESRFENVLKLFFPRIRPCSLLGAKRKEIKIIYISRERFTTPEEMRKKLPACSAPFPSWFKYRKKRFNDDRNVRFEYQKLQKEISPPSRSKSSFCFQLKIFFSCRQPNERQEWTRAPSTNSKSFSYLALILPFIIFAHRKMEWKANKKSLVRKTSFLRLKGCGWGEGARGREKALAEARKDTKYALLAATTISCYWISIYLMISLSQSCTSLTKEPPSVYHQVIT